MFAKLIEFELSGHLRLRPPVELKRGPIKSKAFELAKNYGSRQGLYCVKLPSVSFVLDPVLDEPTPHLEIGVLG
jgi:hypothetical protein